MDDRPKGTVLRVGDLVVDVGARTVAHSGRRIDLTKLSFDLLVALIEASPEAVSTDELIARVWEGRIVSSATVAKRVEMLRQAIGDDAADPHYVLLVRGFGYRIARPVERLERPGGDARQASAPDAAARRRLTWPAIAVAALVLATAALVLARRGEPTRPPPARSLAVLPFEAIGDAPSDRWFADGLSEEIGHSLARSGELLVAGRISTLASARSDAEAGAIGEALGVAHVLSGTVRRDAGRVSVVATLTDVADGYRVWSETFDYTVDDALRVQRDIARRVAERFEIRGAELPVRDPADSSSNPEAYALYLQAVSLSPYPAGPDMDIAQQLIERVVELDPGFAPGWNRRAAIHGRRLYFDPSYPVSPPEAMRTIRESIDRALAIDPTTGGAYANLAGLAWAFDRDLDRASGLIEQAVRFSYWDLSRLTMASDFMRAIGDLQGSRDLRAYILRRDALCVSCRVQYAATLECLGQFDEAEREIRIIENMAPGLSVPSALGTGTFRRGDFDAIEARLLHVTDPVVRLGAEARLAQARGDDAALPRALDRLFEAPPNYWSVQATMAALAGDKARALEALKRGALRRWPMVQALVCAPEFDAFRDDPEWQALMVSLGRNPDGSQAVDFELPPVPGYNSELGDD